MAENPMDPPAVKQESRGLWRVFRFLFKTTLGCAAFAFGSLVALILLLPSMCSSTVARIVEEQFALQYMGRLKITELELAWFGKQHIKSAVLSDPEGKEVARCSASGPSISDILATGGMKLGRVEVELQADLVADEHGSTNLARALQERNPSQEPPDPEDKHKSSSKSMAELDVDLVVRVPRVSWSDHDTRAAGTPVEVRDFEATLAVHPGSGVRLEAHGKQVSEAPSEISLDATIDGPIAIDKPWPFGPMDAHAKIHGLSSALVDGMLRWNGDLRDALGPRFDLDLALSRATLESGEIHLDLTAEHAKLRVAGRIEQGELRSGAEPLLALTATTPRGMLQRFVGQSLPPGARLSVAPDTRPLDLRISNVILPLPKSGASGAGAWLSGIAGLAGKIDLVLPGELAIDLSRGASGGAKPGEAEQVSHFGISNTALRVRVAPGEPWMVALESKLTGESTGKLEVECTLADVANALSTGGLPRGDVSVHVDGVSTAALDALLLGSPALAPGLGPDISLDLSAREFSRDGGSLALDVRAARASVHAEARVEDGVLRGSGERALAVKVDGADILAKSMLAGRSLPFEVLPGAVEITSSMFAVPLAPKAGTSEKLAAALRRGLEFRVQAKLPGSSLVDEHLRAAKARVALSGVGIDARLAPGGALELDVTSSLDTGVPGQLAITSKINDPWSWLAPQPAASATVDAKVTIDRISTTSIDALGGQDGRIVRALGPELACTIEAEAANASAGRVSAELASSALRLTFAAELEHGVLASHGTDGLSVTWRATPDFVAREAGAHLPEGAVLEWPSPHGEVALTLREIKLPLPDAKSSAPGSAASLLEGASGQLELKVASFGYSDAKMRAAKLELDVRDLGLRLALAPRAPAALEVKAKLGMGSVSDLALDVKIKDPWTLLPSSGAPGAPRQGAPPPGAPSWNADAHLKLSAVSTAWLGAWLDQAQTLTTCLGPTFDVELESAGASPRGAHVETRLRSTATDLKLTCDINDERITTAAGDGLKITLTTSAFEALAAAGLPAGAKVRFLDANEPLRLNVSDVLIRLPRSATPSAKDVAVVEAASPAPKDSPLSSLNVRLKADVPPFEYRDATTEAAGKPLVVRGMSCAVEALASAPPSAVLTASIEDQVPGEIKARIGALQSLRDLSATSDLTALSVALDVACRKMPTAWIDALAQQNGLLVDTLGPRMEFTAKSASISTKAGQFTAELSSDKAKMRCEGGFADGALTIQKVDGLSAQFGLTPLASERVVGRLMPMMFDLQKPAGAEPVLLAVDQLHFPLNADLSKLDAIVRINLGEVSYKMLPGLESMLGLSTEAKTTRIPPLKVPIEKGVARYDALPLRLGGRDYIVNGSFNLVDQTMHFATEIPLSALGKSVNEKLDAVRGHLDPATKVPIEIRGTWKKPRVAIGDEFLNRVLTDAASSGLEGLLKDAFGKKKEEGLKAEVRR